MVVTSVLLAILGMRAKKSDYELVHIIKVCFFEHTIYCHQITAHKLVRLIHMVHSQYGIASGYWFY